MERVLPGSLNAGDDADAELIPSIPVPEDVDEFQGAATIILERIKPGQGGRDRKTREGGRAPRRAERYHEAMSRPAIDINAMEPEERLRLISDLWDSLSESPDDVSLTPAQRAELDRRLDRLESGRAKLVSWDELKVRLVG